MRRPSLLFYNVFIFVMAQLAWFSLLGLWIYWYVTNYIIFSEVGDKLSPQLIPESTNVFALVSGLVLLVFISVGMSFIFMYLNRQLNITKLYDNFISNVTHELKSPLSSIQLYLETLYDRQVPATKQKEFISLMLKDTDRLNNLINSILFLSAFEYKRFARKMAHDYQVFYADKIIRELLQESINQNKLDNNAVHVEGKADCRCVVDRNWLKIVFDNLVDNAVKYSMNPVKINVKLNCIHKSIQIEFQDNGVGITAKNQQKIFNKFQRIDHKSIPNVKGTGLGLYWVKEIIRYHGGKISVFSEGENKGTLFKIELPVYQVTKKRYMKNLLKMTKKSKTLAEKENG